MHQYLYSSYVLLSTMLISLVALGQEVEGEVEEDTEKKHRIAVIIGHAHVPEGINKEGDRQWLVLPSWGLDYDYRLSSRWSVGVHTDFVVESFELEEHFGEEQAVLERSRPLAAALVAIYKPIPNLSILLGGGAEIAPEETFGLVRIGVEYGWELPQDWELGVSLMNDIKIDAYNSIIIGLGVGKLF